MLRQIDGGACRSILSRGRALIRGIFEELRSRGRWRLVLVAKRRGSTLLVAAGMGPCRAVCDRGR